MRHTLNLFVPLGTILRDDKIHISTQTFIDANEIRKSSTVRNTPILIPIVSVKGRKKITIKQ
jgi:hypothetical protein